MKILFVLRKPKLPCILFSRSNVFATTRLSDLAQILTTISDSRIELYDVDGRQYSYQSEKSYIYPTLATKKISKKALLERTFASTNLLSTDFQLKNKNLGNILYPKLFQAVVDFIKSQAEP
jgi:hypothetical protein